MINRGKSEKTHTDISTVSLYSDFSPESIRVATLLESQHMSHCVFSAEGESCAPTLVTASGTYRGVEEINGFLEGLDLRTK